MSYQFTAGRFKGWASDNTPLAAGRLYTYSSGTTTHKAAYTDATLGAACTYVSDGVGGLYIALDSKGEAQLWLGSGAYTFKLTDSSGSTVWTVDGVRDQSEAALSQLSASSGSSLVGFLQSGSGAIAHTIQDKLRESVSVLDFGADLTGATDSAAAINAALAAAKRVHFPLGTYAIGSPIIMPTQRLLTGDGIGTVIKALPALALAAKPGISAATYSPVLGKVPMLCNTSSIQWWGIKGIYFDGNGQDVYGIWLAENFYGQIEDTYVINTASRPYTNIRGQGVSHTNFVCYGCDDGVVLYDNTNMSFSAGGFERLAASWYVDQRQPNPFAKGGVKFDGVWFESDPTHRPTDGFLKLAGRRNVVDIHAALDTAATTEKSISLSSTADSRTVDAIVMTNSACVGADVTVNNVSGAMFMEALAGSGYNKVRGFFTAANVTDNGTSNQWNVNASLAAPVEHVNTRFQVRGPLSLTATDYAIDVQWNSGTPVIYMLKSTGKYFDLNGANWRMTSNSGFDFVGGGTGNITMTATSFVMNSTTGAFVPPTMTTAQRDAIAAPVNGMVIFNSTLGKLQGRESGAWANLI